MYATTRPSLYRCSFWGYFSQNILRTYYYYYLYIIIHIIYYVYICGVYRLGTTRYVWDAADVDTIRDIIWRVKKGQYFCLFIWLLFYFFNLQDDPTFCLYVLNVMRLLQTSLIHDISLITVIRSTLTTRIRTYYNDERMTSVSRLMDSINNDSRRLK